MCAEIPMFRSFLASSAKDRVDTSHILLKIGLLPTLHPAYLANSVAMATSEDALVGENRMDERTLCARATLRLNGRQITR